MFRKTGLAGWLLIVGLVPQAFGQDSSPVRRQVSAAVFQSFLKQYCRDCHGGEKPEGNVSLAKIGSWEDLGRHPHLIEKIIKVLDRNEMPPAEANQPTDAERDAMQFELGRVLRKSVAENPTSSSFRMRRMNRFEYGNAVRDLFELDSWVYSINDRIIRDHNGYFQPETGKMPDVVVVGNRIMGLQQLLENRLLGVMPFPKDPPAENGFNNRGDHLSLTPVLMQSFLELSQSVVNAENFDRNCGVWKDLFEDPENPRPAEKVVAMTDRDAMNRGPGVAISAWLRMDRVTDGWQTVVRREAGWRRQLLSIGKTGNLWGLWMGAGINGKYVEFGAEVDRKKLGDGQWHHVAGSYDGKRMELYVDGVVVGTRDLEGKLDTQSRSPMEVGSYGGRELFHGDLKDVRLFRDGLPHDQIKSLARGAAVVANDLLVGRWPVSRSEPGLSGRSVVELAHQRIDRFLLRAFRSPADERTSALYKNYFDKRYAATGDFTQSMKQVVSAALASPRFILVHNESSQHGENQADYNLATRLSFFLWSSIPDQHLLQLAESGKLQDRKILMEQVDRMLSDRKVKNFCDSFAPQWLKLNNLVSASPDFEQHREYYFGGDDKISYKRGMHMMLEPLLNFETVFIENRPLLELVDADFTYRSHLLSEWYQGRAATYPINVNLRHIEYKRVPLTDRRYGGVMTTSAIMVMTSSPFRSLPITRGSWVSSVIFNDPPKPPPDNVPVLNADDETLQKEGMTVREKLQQHSSDPQCASCHRRIDPLGFALENFDLLGRWRDDYRTGLEVDASGRLFGKSEFHDVVGLKNAINAEKQIFVTAFVKHLISYALGRELTLQDRMAAEEIARQSAEEGYRMRNVIRNIVVHPVFSQGGRK